jgi:hypothetical protein
VFEGEDDGFAFQEGLQLTQGWVPRPNPEAVAVDAAIDLEPVWEADSALQRKSLTETNPLTVQKLRWGNKEHYNQTIQWIIADFMIDLVLTVV